MNLFMKKGLIFTIFFLFTVTSSFVSAATYYVSNTGNDSYNANQAQSENTPWKTISKINKGSFRPGDTIKFKAGDVWREELTIAWSGTSGNPITFTRYGTGTHPLISSGEKITPDMWEQKSAHIYSYNTMAADSTWVNPWGAIDSNGTLMSKYWYGYPGSDYDAPSSTTKPLISELEDKMIDGFTWTPRNYGTIFVRSDSGNPGTLIVGKRHSCITIRYQDYITIDGIDFEGPGGGGYDSQTSKEASGVGNALIDGTRSEYLIIQNCNLKNAVRAAIRLDNGCNYSFVDNNTITNCWAGVVGYGSSKVASATHNVTVSNNIMTNIGAQIASMGDRAFVSTWGHHWTVENNYFENQGWKGQAESENYKWNPVMDRAVHMCCGKQWGGESGYHIIRGNYFKNLGTGAIFVTDGGHNEIYNNIVDGWNLNPANYRQDTAYAIESKTYNSAPVTPVLYNNKIWNNVIYGGKLSSTQFEQAGIRVVGQHMGLEIVNNIVYGNDAGISAIKLYIESGANSNNNIMNNIFNTPSGVATIWGNNYFDVDYVTSGKGCPNSDFWECYVDAMSRMNVHGNKTDIPLFEDASNGNFRLLKGSPGIDDGIAVPVTTDYKGKSRPQGDGFDIGAYEYVEVARKGINPVDQVAGSPKEVKNLRSIQRDCLVCIQ